ncbi:hypothetical protein LXL04_014616 [Taraxacum kok-saghyz]
MALLTASSGLATGHASITCFVKPQSASIRLKSNSQAVSELGFVTSQFTGLKISYQQCTLPTNLSSPIKLPLQPVARNRPPFISVNVSFLLNGVSLFHLIRNFPLMIESIYVYHSILLSSGSIIEVKIGLYLDYSTDDVDDFEKNGNFSGRICPFTGKKSNRKNLVSHSNHKTKKLQFVNLQYKRVWWEAGKRFVKLRLSTKALKTIEKNGLDAVAKKAGIDLSKK